MKNTLSRKNIPLIVLISLSFYWTYFYTSNNWLNEYGAAKLEWLLIIDIFITIPLVCYFCLKNHLKQALIKMLIYMGLLILLGSYIIPTEQKFYWLYLEYLRYAIIAVVILFELFIITSVIFAIKTAFSKNQDPDVAIASPVEKIFGKSIASELIKFDLRLWSFALFPKRIESKNYLGSHHFHCHLKDGTQSFLQGFVFLSIFELPLVHVLLHFIWSPMAANIITGLTLFSLAYLVAQYRAVEKRPISFTNEQLIIRYALSNPLIINLNDIESAEINTQVISRNQNIKRFNLLGAPNVKIELKNSKDYGFHTVYLGINLPTQFISFIVNKLNTNPLD
jgi:hypothetical protein